MIEYDIVIKITETFHLKWEFNLIYFPDALEILRPVRTQALGERDYYGL